MRRRYARFALFAISMVPLAVFAVQQTAPQKEKNAEEVYKNITVFKGVPASDLIPAMEFMSASLGMHCEDCHSPTDYSLDTPTKETARKMVIMQRDINAKYFDNHLEVTCMSCHNGKEHPAGPAVPTGLVLRHERVENAPKPDALFSKHMAALGKANATITRVGTLTAANDVSHKVETLPLEYIQTSDGKFRLVSGERKIVGNGSQVTYGGYPLNEEPLAIFSRIGRSWRNEGTFKELQNPTVSGKDKIGTNAVLVVRGNRPSTASTEELWFDSKTGLLSRSVNIKRSTIGTVISMIEYSGYKDVSGVKVPMKVVVTFADNSKWVMTFKTAKAGAVPASTFGTNQP